MFLKIIVNRLFSPFREFPGNLLYFPGNLKVPEIVFSTTVPKCCKDYR